MDPDVTQLQARAIEFARTGDFGAQALETNLELARLAPDNQGAWTRLSRCYLERGQLDEATAVLDRVLQISPQNTIARSLQVEVSKRRSAAMGVVPTATRTRAPRASSAARPAKPPSSRRSVPAGGFGRAEFHTLGQLAPAAALEALGGRLEGLLMSLNDRPFAARAVEARNRGGQSGSRLFRRNSIHATAHGHLQAYQHGGGWEPQFNLGFLSATPFGRDAVRAGLAFQLARDDASDGDASRAGQERSLESFAQFQQLIASAWRPFLSQWLATHAGFVQYGHEPPRTDLLPNDTLSWLVGCQQPVDAGWIFVGAWLFPDRHGDAETLADSRRFLSWIEGSFTDLSPLWSTIYRA